MADEINDGGPAFPRTVQRWNDSLDHVEGMSKREEYASRALAGILAGLWANPDASGWDNKGLAEEAVACADALIAELAKRGDR